MPQQANDDGVRVVFKHGLKTPKFKGLPSEKARMHWLLFTDYLEELDITDEAQKIRKFKLTLTDNAREWYDIHKASFTNLATLEKLFVQAYGPPEDRTELLRQFSQAKMSPAETVTAFKNRLSSLAHNAKITDQVMVLSQFVNGLPESIQQAVRVKRDGTLEEAHLTALAAQPPTQAVPTIAQSAAVYAIQHSQGSQQQKTSTNDMAIASEMEQLYIAKRDSSFSPQRGRRDTRYTNANRYRDHSRSVSRGRNNYRSQSQEKANSRYWSKSPDRSAYQAPARDRQGGSGRFRLRSNSRDRQSPAPYDRRGSPAPKRVQFKSNGDSRTASPSPGACHYCGKRGHYWENCMLFREAMRQGRIKHQNFH